MRIAKNTRTNRPIHVIRGGSDSATLCGFVAHKWNGWRASEVGELGQSEIQWLCKSCRRVLIGQIRVRTPNIDKRAEQEKSDQAKLAAWNGEAAR